ncbi:MAG: hypothetical protein COA94_02345 [Rickettsiales bacterium]|nr:MAG: hypothetical protein COA94_02345 [Rickettsiales bacterium]
MADIENQINVHIRNCGTDSGTHSFTSSDSFEDITENITEDIVEGLEDIIVDDVKEMIKALRKKIFLCDIKAKTYRISSNFLAILIILMASTLGAYESFQTEKNIPVITISFAIATLKVLHQYINTGNRGTFYKVMHIKFRKMFTNATYALETLDNNDELLEFAKILRNDIDNLDLSLYGAPK